MEETNMTENTANTPEPPAPSDSGTADLGDSGKKALQSERDRARELEKQLNAVTTELESFRTEKLSDVERATRRAEAAEKALSEAAAASLRQRVALETGLPPALMGRLMGSNESELRADAMELLGLVTTPRTPRPDPSQGATSVGLNETDPLLASLKEKLGIA